MRRQLPVVARSAPKLLGADLMEDPVFLESRAGAIRCASRALNPPPETSVVDALVSVLFFVLSVGSVRR